MKTNLTAVQSEYLVRLGISEDKASGEKELKQLPEHVLYGIPMADDEKWGWFKVFTLADLLELIPTEITDHTGTYGLRMEFGECGWSAYYVDYGIDGDDDEPYADGLFIASELIDAVYELLCWTLIREKK